MKKLLLIIVCVMLYSCGPKRKGCGPNRCEVNASQDIAQKNPETKVSGFYSFKQTNV